MKRIIIMFLVALFVPVSAHAYHMPEYRIVEQDWRRPSETVLAEHAQRMDDIASRARLSRLENYKRCHNCRLTKQERAAYREYQVVKVPYRFWQYVVDLKGDLIALVGTSDAASEADLLAKMIVEKLYALSNEYGIAGSALIHNALINIGAKDKGFCYHYTDALRKTLGTRQWRYYDFHWGAAHDRSFLENNGLVITAKGKPFETGIVVDSWRKASKPFWIAVSDDYYPWKELKNVHIAEE